MVCESHKSWRLIFRFSQPIDSVLLGAQRVLIAGAGGGYDFLCGLPVARQLQERGVETHFSNLSFTPLSATNARRHSAILWEANADSSGSNYFPEAAFARWQRRRNEREVSVWCFAASGLEPYRAALKELVEWLCVDTIIVVDGGVDSLLRGDEFSLGTPLWDALTVGAAHSLQCPRKVLMTTAFGAERWDKISHAQALFRIAELTRENALLGVVSILRQTPEGADLCDAARFIFDEQSTSRGSIVVSTLLAALRGEYGEMPVCERTQQTPLWVSPLAALCWFFDLDTVARHKLFLRALNGTQTLTEAGDALQKWRAEISPAPWQSIPI